MELVWSVQKSVYVYLYMSILAISVYVCMIMQLYLYRLYIDSINASHITTTYAVSSLSGWPASTSASTLRLFWLQPPACGTNSFRFLGGMAETNTFELLEDMRHEQHANHKIQIYKHNV